MRLTTCCNNTMFRYYGIFSRTVELYEINHVAIQRDNVSIFLIIHFLYCVNLGPMRMSQKIATTCINILTFAINNTNYCR